MTRLVNPSRVNGSIHQLSTLQSLGTDKCNVLFCSDQVMYLLANYAAKDVAFYGRYTTDYINDNQAFVVEDGDSETGFIDRLVEDFQLQTRGDDMEIANALNNIAYALQAQQQCCDGPTTQGTGGSSGQSEAPSEGIDNGSTPPTTTSFATYTEYEAYKCSVANYIVDDADNTANLFQTLAWNSILALPVTELVLVLAATVVSPIPGDEIIALASILALWGGAFTPVFDTLEAAIDNNRQDLVCALYSSADVNGAIADFRQAMDDAIDNESAAGTLLNTVVKGASRVFITTDNFNKLFTEDSSRTYPTGSIDCALCSSPVVSVKFQLSPTGMIEMGSGDLATDGLVRTLSSVFIPEFGQHYCNFGVYGAPSTLSYATSCAALPPGVSGTPQENFEFTINSGPGVASTLGTKCLNSVHTQEFGPAFPPFGVPQQITWMENIGSAPFSIEVILLSTALP